VRLQRSLPWLMVLLLVTGLAMVGLAAPASAHSQQVGSSPEADAVLSVAPTEVVVEFDSPLVDMGAAMAVRGEDDQSITTGPPVIGDRLLSVPVDPAAPPGQYTVAYRVVSEDGHTITSTFTFEVAGEAATGVTGASTATPSAPVTASPDGGAGSPANAGVSPVLVASVAALAIGLAFIAAIALRR
jgi:methionine-rich copper-binding protein CopC